MSLPQISTTPHCVRLREHEEFLGKFRARKFEFEVVFGKDAGAPFDEVRKVHNDIVWAVEDVFRNKEIRAPNATPDMRDEYRRLRNVIFSSPQNDSIAERIAVCGSEDRSNLPTSHRNGGYIMTQLIPYRSAEAVRARRWRGCAGRGSA
jgi:hypothetical protein